MSQLFSLSNQSECDQNFVIPLLFTSSGFYQKLAKISLNISGNTANPISAVAYTLKMSGKIKKILFSEIPCGNLCKFYVLIL